MGKGKISVLTAAPHRPSAMESTVQPVIPPPSCRALAQDTHTHTHVCTYTQTHAYVHLCCAGKQTGRRTLSDELRQCDKGHPLIGKRLPAQDPSFPQNQTLLPSSLRVVPAAPLSASPQGAIWRKRTNHQAQGWVTASGSTPCYCERASCHTWTQVGTLLSKCGLRLSPHDCECWQTPFLSVSCVRHQLGLGASLRHSPAMGPPLDTPPPSARSHRGGRAATTYLPSYPLRPGSPRQPRKRMIPSKLEPAPLAAPSTCWRVSRSRGQEIKPDTNLQGTPARGGSGVQGRAEGCRGFFQEHARSKGSRPGGLRPLQRPPPPAPGALQLLPETERAAGSARPPSPLPRAAKPLALAPRLARGAGGGTARQAAAPLLRGPPALLCFSQEEASYTRTKRARGSKARRAASPAARRRDPAGPPYLRGLSAGTAPCSAHRPRPPLAVRRGPNHRRVAERSRARSGTSRPRSPPAPSSWRGAAGGPRRRGRRRGQAPPRRSAEVRRALPAPGI